MMTEAEPERVVRWHQRRWVVLAGLLLVFPVGLVLLAVSPWPRRWQKLAVAAVFAVVFAANLHFVIGSRFSTWWHDRKLAREREEQRNEPMPDLPPIAEGASPADWPGFRGAERDGVVRGGALELPWPDEGPRLAWEQLVGGGHASFAIAYGRAYTIEQLEKEEVVTCFAVETGREIWAEGYPALFDERLGGRGPRATPVVEGDRVYSLGAIGVLVCLDAATGDLIWKRNILEDASADNLQWGMSGSPLVHQGRVYVAPGGKNASVISYDAASGEPIWKSGGYKAGYSSPVVATLLDAPHLLVFDGAGLSAYAPDDGAELWHFPWKTDYDINVGQPIVVNDDRVFISSGYDHGCCMLRVSRADDGYAVEQLWFNRNLKLKFSSAVLREGAIYGLDEKILTCVDVETGERRWKGGRYGFGQLILAGGYLIIQCEDGDLTLVEATPDAHREIARVDALDGKTWNHPALADGRLLLRNDRRMMCFDLSPSGK